MEAMSTTNPTPVLSVPVEMTRAAGATRGRAAHAGTRRVRPLREHLGRWALGVEGVVLVVVLGVAQGAVQAYRNVRDGAG